MPMELVDFVHSQNINHILDLLNREDIATHIEHKTTILEVGFIVNLTSWNLYTRASLVECCNGQHLTQSLHSIEYAVGGRCRDID